MKKSILALAVLGSLPGAVWAANPGVQLYGLIDMGVTHYTGLAPQGGAAGQTVSSTGLSGSVQSGSRIGVKGDEDLGNGLSSIFDVETGFCSTGVNQDGTAADTSPKAMSNGFCSAGGFMQRQAWVGLKGDFGTLQMGRMYTIGLLNEADVDPFNLGLTGDISNLALFGSQGHFALVRANEDVQYTSPDLSGFTLAGAYSFAPFGQGAEPTGSGAGTNVPRDLSLNVAYARGPIAAGLDYTAISNSPYGLSAAGIDSGKMSVWQAYGTYDLGVAKLRGLYERATGDYAFGTTTGQAGNANQYWLLGATVPLGRGTILASIGEARIDQNSVFQATSVYGTARQYAVGYTYALSKSTNVFASYSRISNDAHTAFAVGSATDVLSGVAGQASTGAALGIRHMF